MFRRRGGVCVLTVISLLVLFSIYHLGKPPVAAAQSSPNGAGMGLPSGTYMLSGSFWRTDGTFISTVRIKNILAIAPLDVIPTLFMADGTPYVLPSVHIPTSGVVTINVNDALAAAPPSIASHLSSYGTAMLMWSYTSPGHVAASIAAIDAPRSLIFIFPFAMPMGQSGRQTVDGLWWKHDPGVRGFVAVSNTGGFPTQASIQLVGPGVENQPSRTVPLAPYATQLLPLEDLATNIAALAGKSGGVRVQYTGDGIQVVGGLENDTTGYSANMPFWQDDTSPATPAPISYALAGVLLGKPDPAMMPGFSKTTTFSPYLAMRNTTEKPLDVSLQLNYTAGGAAVNRDLPEQHLAPLESRQLHLQPALIAAGLSRFNGSINLSVSFIGKQGDLILASGSVDQTGTYVFEVLVQGVGKSRSKHSDYWSAESGNDTMITLWNDTGSAQDIVGTFYFGDGSGSYEIRVHLAAQGSTMIDMAMLIAENKADSNGHVFPPNAREGSAQFASANGRQAFLNLVIASGTYNVVTATCGCNCICCCPVSGFGISPSSFSVALGDQMACQTSAVDCNGYGYNPSSWSSSNNPVMTVNSSGTVSAVSVGSATIYAHWNNIDEVNYCNLPGPCPLTNQQAQSSGKSEPYVQVSSISVNPSTLNQHATPNQVTITVQVFHTDTSSLTNPTVTVEIGTYSASPSGNSVTYNPTQQSVPVAGAQGNKQVTFNVCCPGYAGSVTVAATLANPSSGLAVKDPGGPSNYQTSLTTTTN